MDQMSREEIESEVDWTSGLALTLSQTYRDDGLVENPDLLAEDLANYICRLHKNADGEIIQIAVHVLVPMVVSKLGLLPHTHSEITRTVCEKLRIKLPALQEPDDGTRHNITAICAAYLVRLGKASRAKRKKVDVPPRAA